MHTFMYVTPTFILSNFIKILPGCLLIVLKCLMIFWSIAQTFSKFSGPCKKLGFIYLYFLIIIFIALVWTGYSQIKTRYICISYQIIFEVFISSAVAIQNLVFLCKYKIWAKAASCQALSVVKSYKHGQTLTITTLSVVSQWC